MDCMLNPTSSSRSSQGPIFQESDRLLDDRFVLTKSLGVHGTTQSFIAEDRDSKKSKHRLRVWTRDLNDLPHDWQRDLSFFQNRLESRRELRHSSLGPTPTLYWEEVDERLVAICAAPQMSGSSLYKSCARAPWNAVSELLAQVLRGLEFLHSQDIYQGSLSPRRVTVQGGGQRKIARLIYPGNSDLTELYEFFSSEENPLDIAPEIVAGEQHDRRSDLYAFGLMFYEVCCRHHPFEKSKDRNMTPPRELKATLPKSFEQIILRLLDEQAENRYATANAVIRELSAASKKRYAVEPKQGRLSTVYAAGTTFHEKALGHLVDHVEGKLTADPPESPGVILLKAPAGSGKSSLLRGLRRALTKDKRLWIRSRYRDGSREGLLKLIARTLDAIEDLDNGEHIRKRHGAVLARAFPELNLSFAPAPALGSGEDLQRLVSATVALFLGLAQNHPGLIVEFEDAEFCDPLSLKIISALSRVLDPNNRDGELVSETPSAHSSQASLCVLISVNKDELYGRLAEKIFDDELKSVEQVELQALTKLEGSKLIASLLGREISQCGKLHEQIGELVGRTPLSLIQCLHDLVQRRWLRAPGQDVHKESVQLTELPYKSLPELLDARLQSLDSIDREGLRLIGLAGSLSTERLSEILNISQSELAWRVRRLQRNALLNRNSEDKEWRLVSTLLEERLLANMDTERRQENAEKIGQNFLRTHGQFGATDLIRKASQLDRAVHLLVQGNSGPGLGAALREVARGNSRSFNHERSHDLWNNEIKLINDVLASEENIANPQEAVPADALTWTALPPEAIERRRLLQSAWFERGFTALALERPHDARSDFELALKGARALRQPKDVIRALLALGDLEWRGQNYAKAQFHLEEALNLSKEISWFEGLTHVSSLLARVFEAQNRFALGLDVLQRLESSTTHKSPQPALELLRGRLLLAHSQSMEARERLELALESLDEGHQGFLMVEALCLLSSLEQNDGHPRKALQYAKKALSQAKGQYSDTILATALSRLASVFAFQGQVQDALQTFGRALRRAEASQDSRRRQRILHEQGTLLRRLGHFKEAAEVFQNSVHDSQHDPDGALQASIELARCHLLTGDVGLARKTLESTRKKGASPGIELEALGLQADIALKVGDLTKGLEFAKQAVETAGRLGDRAAETRGRLTQGQLLLALGRIDEAYSELREAKQLASAVVLWSSLAEAQLGLGAYHSLVGQPGPALSAFEGGRDAAQKAGDRVVEVRSLQALGRFHGFLGQNKRALAHLDMALNQAREAGLKLEDIDIRLSLLQLELEDGQLSETKLQSLNESLTQLETDVRQSSLRGLRPHMELIRSRLLWAKGDVKAARQRARAAIEAARIGRYGLVEIEAGVILAQLHGLAGKWESAQKQAQATHDVALKLQLGEAQARAQAVLASAYLAQNDARSAAQCLREAAIRIRAIWASLPEDLRGDYLSKAFIQSFDGLTKDVLEKSSTTDVPAPAPAPKGAVLVSAPASAPQEPLRDVLTGVFNHGYFMSQLDLEVKRAKRHSRSLVLIKTNIDRFKLVRELYGSQVSKTVIKGVSEVVARNLRDVDLVARYFGDQFEILLPDTDAAGGLLTAERVRDAVEQASFEHEGERIDVTLSIGLVVFPDDASDRSELVQRCDEALYNSRSVGPNHIFSFVNQGEEEDQVTDESLRDLDALLLSREGRVIVSMINRIVNTNLAFDEMTKLVTSMVVDATRGQRGFFMIMNDYGELEFRHGQNMDNETVNVTHGEISLGIAKEVARRGEAMLIEEALDDDRFRSYKSVLDLRLRSILCAPIKRDGEVLGVVYVDHNSISRHFTKEDLNFLKAIAERIAVPLAHSKRLDDAERKLREAQVQLQASQNALQTKYRYENIIGRSKPMVSVLQLLDRVVDTHHSIVIHGESGTGKELVARAIHYNGPRKDKPFIAENCAALADTLMEAELFGHVKGAFTGADRDSKGLFELANGGTLFLDEIGDMSEPMQKKLLRVLQEGEIRPVGGKRAINVDVRIISASNKDLRELVATGLFREDLYYRLNVIKVDLPPLRDRKDDIPLLVDHFLTKIVGNKQHGMKIDRDVLRVLTEYDWPGNIRELENEINRLLAMTDGKIRVEDLSPKVIEQVKTVDAPTVDRMSRYYNRPLKEVEREMMIDVITHTLEQTNWHRTKAAKILDIPTSTLFNKMKKFGIGS
ncbi:MAG: sigma 54-interacting transcriptional regulator [Planctomycetota bacterium]|nr:sigma 54-interacting transcriptional regulator [Planctomycetota bacterium]